MSISIIDEFRALAERNAESEIAFTAKKVKEETGYDSKPESLFTAMLDTYCQGEVAAPSNKLISDHVLSFTTAFRMEVLELIKLLKE